MARIEEHIGIRAPAGDVFAILTDAARWSTWHTAIREAAQTSAGPVGVGTTFRGVTELMGRRMPWTAKATEYEPDRAFTKEIDSGSVFIDDHYTLVPTPGGTELTIRYEMRFSGVMRLMAPMIVHSMRKEVKKSLARVKQILEAG